MNGFMLKASVAVSSAAYAFDKPFSYLIPEDLQNFAVPGKRAVVPFGKGNRKRLGIILNIDKLQADETGLKPLFSIPDDEPVLNKEMLDMLEWLKDNTFCTYYDAVKTILPSGLNINLDENYCLAEPLPEFELTAEEENFLNFLLQAKTKKEFKSLTDTVSNQDKCHIIKSLTEKKYLISELKQKRSVGDSVIKMLRLTDSYNSKPEEFRLTVKQKQIVELLNNHELISIKEACYLCNVTQLVVKNLIKSGAAEEYINESFRTVKHGESDIRSIEDVILSDYQTPVFEEVKQQMDTGKPKCYLLHGITGSGKTSVFEKLIGHCVKLGKQSILLIPEISLTPQMVSRFQELFGEAVAVIHSSLSAGQRLDEYKRIKKGIAKIAVGTRSAVFAPFDNLGLIIVDEEGERSYKSDNAPRYSAIEAAKKRCRTHNGVLLLASATPSVESFYNAKKGRYELLEMTSRYSGAVLPQVNIVDMNEERMEGNTSEFSRVLTDEINCNLKNGEQTILLLNRRGYHTIISCCDCHKPIYCPNCSIPMTFHKINGAMMCHYCGHSQQPAEKCPECGSSRLKQMGFGTQKMEEELETLFPEAKILRMDADTTFSRYSYEKKFKAFSEGKYDIMIGTQMIGKGLDFPNVTLVGVLSVDKALFSGDFRSYERTFSLITQVVGRCGRGQKQGRAYLQTFMPEHYVLNLAAKQDYVGFYDQEITVRRSLIFPPVCDICVFGISGEQENKVYIAAKQLFSIIKNKVQTEAIKFPLRVLGPVKCTYGKINGKYRYRIILKCKNTAELRAFISSILIEASKYKELKGINIYADINGEVGI